MLLAAVLLMYKPSISLFLLPVSLPDHLTDRIVGLASPDLLLQKAKVLGLRGAFKLAFVSGGSVCGVQFYLA